MTTLPLSIRLGLARVGIRLKAHALARGAGVAALVSAVGVALSMALDFAWPLPVWVRVLVWAVWVAAASALLVLLGVWPLFRRVGWVDLAAVAERAHPALEERLTCAVALTNERERVHGSPALVGALVDEAVAHTRGLDLGQAVPLQRGQRQVVLGALALLLVTIPAIVRPDPFAQLLRRAVAPWAGVERVGRFMLTVQPGSRLVGLGSELEVSAEVGSRFGPADRQLPAEAWLEWTDARGTSRRVRMPALEAPGPRAGHAFALRLPALAGSMRYRVESGSARSQMFQITAVELPAVERLSVVVKPPAYTGLPAGPVRNVDRIEAWAGSRVLLTVSPTKPVRSAAIAWRADPKDPGEARKRDETFERTTMQAANDGKQWTASLQARAPGVFGIDLTDEHGLESGAQPLHRLLVHVDAPPVVKWASPDDLNDARADDTLTARVVARDDVVVATAELLYEIKRGASATDARESGETTVKLAGLGSNVARGEARLGLGTLGLKQGDTLLYCVRVTDNRPDAFGGPQVGITPVRTVRINTKAAPLLARRQDAEQKTLRGQLDALKKAAAANRQETEQLRYAADAALRGNGRWTRERDEALASRERAARSVVDALHLLAQDFDQRPAFQPLARPAQQAGDVEAEAGRAMLDQARRAPDDARRLTDLQQADSRLAAVQQKLDDLERKFEALAKLEQDRQRLLAQAERQQKLAAEAEALAKQAEEQAPDRGRLARLQNAQEKLRGELEALMKQSPALRGDVLAAQAQEAAALAERAYTLASKQHNEARRTAELVRQNPKLKALAEDQRNLEADARRLALEVDPPLNENGRGGVNTDVLDRAIEPIERGDVVQARDRLEEGENDLRRITRDLEDVRGDPKALARRLARRQDALIGPVNEAARGATGKLTAEESAVVMARLQPLLVRQKAIARLAQAIRAPQAQADAARTAARLATRAADDLQRVRLRDLESHLREARDALSHLADALPDPWQRQEPARQKLGEVRRLSEQVARDLEKHLRETGPEPGKSFDARRAATDLAGRVATLVQRQDESEAMLNAMDVDARVQPQRDRAVRRARSLTEGLRAIRDEATLLDGQQLSRPIASWQVVGPFPLAGPLPFSPSDPIDVNARFQGRNDAEVAWKETQASNGQGLIDLGQIYARDDGLAAFSYTEIKSPVKGTGQLVVGSDDTLTVWVNGHQIYHFDGNRAFGADQARVDVPLVAGKNRILVRCGNRGGEWQFAVSVVPPTSSKFDANRFQALRELLPALQLEARTALDRLEQQLHGRTPDDVLVAELADDQRALAERMARDEKHKDRAAEAADQARIAVALRGLKLPEAPVARDEAIRLAEQAVRALADAQSKDAVESVSQAAQALDVLVLAVGDQLSLHGQVDMLARAQRALEQPEGNGDLGEQARRQRAIATALTRVPVEGKQRAERQVDHAATLIERAAHPDDSRPENGPPAAKALADARAEAARALDALAARQQADGFAATEAARSAVRASVTPLALNDPELGIRPEQITAAGKLARRERQIRERLQAIAGEQIGPQEEIKHQVEALGRDLADLRDRAKPLSPRSDGPAAEAARALAEEAPRVMGEGTEHLAQGRLDAARDSQRHAASVLEHAAQQTDDLATALRADRPAEAGPERADQGRLAQAREAQRQASRQLAQARDERGQNGETRAAASSMQAAAAGMQAAAQPANAAGEGSGNATELAERGGEARAQGGGAASRAGNVSGAAGSVATDSTMLPTAAARRTGRTWGELPGHLRTEILQMSEGRYREDYARLIQLYFREIAAGSDAENR